MEKLTALICILFWASACDPSTEIVESWRKPEINKTYDKVMVAALTSDLRTKNTLEHELTNAMITRRC